MESKYHLCKALCVEEEKPWEFSGQIYKVDNTGILRHLDPVEKTWGPALGIRVCEIINNFDLIKRW